LPRAAQDIFRVITMDDAYTFPGLPLEGMIVRVIYGHFMSGTDQAGGQVLCQLFEPPIKIGDASGTQDSYGKTHIALSI
jgi:hypothetical protein